MVRHLQLRRASAMITVSFLRNFRTPARFRQPVDGTVAPPGGWTGRSAVFVAAVFGGPITNSGGWGGKGEGRRAPEYGELGWHLICLALRVSSTASRPASERGAPGMFICN